MLAEFLAQYGIEIGAISLGTITLLGWQVVRFFKKDKYLLPFVNIARIKMNEIFGVENVKQFIAIAKNTDVKEVQSLVENKWQDFIKLDNKLNLLFKVWLATGTLDEIPELKAEVEQFVE